MAEYLAEQMRSLARRLEELAHNPLPDTGLEGSLNAKGLAELLGVGDIQTFTRSITKIRNEEADKLTRMEMTELAEAFVRLLALEEKQTQKAMQALKRVSAKAEPMMEDTTDHISIAYTPTLPLVRLFDYNTWDLKNAPKEITALLDKISGTLPPVISADWKKNNQNPRNRAAKQFAMDLVKLGFRDNAKYGDRPLMEGQSIIETSQEFLDKAKDLVSAQNGTMIKNGNVYEITIPNLKDNQDMKMSFKLRKHDAGDVVADYKGPFTNMKSYNKGWSFVEALPHVVKHFIKAFEKGELTSAPPTNRAQASKMGYVPKFIPRS